MRRRGPKVAQAANARRPGTFAGGVCKRKYALAHQNLQRSVLGEICLTKLRNERCVTRAAATEYNNGG